MGSEARARVLGVEAILALTISGPPKLRSLFLRQCSERSRLSSLHRSNSSDSTYTSRPPHHTTRGHLYRIRASLKFPSRITKLVYVFGQSDRRLEFAKSRTSHATAVAATGSSPRLGSVSEIEGDHTLIASDDFIKADVILGGKKIEAPVLFQGIDHSLNPANTLVRSPSAYSANPKTKLGNPPSLTGSTISLVSILQQALIGVQDQNGI